jgi:sugar (glycoside-pentoside-hexuronide) transporter
MVTKKERSLYGLFFTGQNMIYLFVMNYLQNYFTDVVGVTAGAVAVILLAARIWDAVNDPLFGVVVDRCRFKSGRFKPWLRISSFLIPAVTALLFFVPSAWPLWLKTAVGAGLYILWDMSYTVCDVPAQSIVTVMTDALAERTALISRGRFHSMLGILVVMVSTVPLVNLLQKTTGSAALAWGLAAALFSLVALFLMVFLGGAAQERFVDQSSEPLSLGAMLKSVSGNKYLLLFYGALVLANMTNTTTVLPLYFANVNLGDSNKYVLLVAVTMIGSPFVSLLMPKLNRRFDKRTLFLFGLALTFFASIASYFVGYEGARFVPFLLLCTVKGLGYSICTVLSYLFTSDCIEYGAFVTRKRSEGVAFSLQTFTTKVTGAISGFIAMGLLGWLFGYRSAYYEAGALITPTQPASAARGIWLLFSIFPAIGAALAFGILFFAYKLRDKDVQVMADVNSGKLPREEGAKRLEESGWSCD